MMPRPPLRAEVEISVKEYERTLAKLAIADDAFYESLLAREGSGLSESHLDEKTHALVRLGAVVAVDSSAPGYMWTVENARRHGASGEEIVGCLIAALPAVGVARIVEAAPKLSLALGYDVTAALEDSAPETEE
jgi:4-carboxymuconolactone decarboxylase